VAHGGSSLPPSPTTLDVQYSFAKKFPDHIFLKKKGNKNVKEKKKIQFLRVGECSLQRTGHKLTKPKPEFHTDATRAKKNATRLIITIKNRGPYMHTRSGDSEILCRRRPIATILQHRHYSTIRTRTLPQHQQWSSVTNVGSRRTGGSITQFDPRT
jgi:hypothetical protein